VAVPSTTKRSQWANPANLITLLRLLLGPWIGWLLVRGDFGSALFWFAIAGSTDWLDGILARRLAHPTALGAYLDPVADKVLLGVTFIASGIARLIPLWLVGLVLARYSLILAFSAYALRCTTIRSLTPTLWGKLSTFFQLMVIGYGLARRMAPEMLPELWGRVLIALATVATIWSWIHYTWRALGSLRTATR
jgi:cardiolipin synthase (CMP-forming)